MRYNFIYLNIIDKIKVLFLILTENFWVCENRVNLKWVFEFFKSYECVFVFASNLRWKIVLWPNKHYHALAVSSLLSVAFSIKVTLLLHGLL